MKRTIRLVPDKMPSLSIDDGREAAKAAFFRAKDEQIDLASHMTLTQRLYAPGKVTYAKLRGMQRQAQEQADQAQKVADLLQQAVEAMEAAVRP